MAVVEGIDATGLRSTLAHLPRAIYPRTYLSLLQANAGMDDGTRAPSRTSRSLDLAAAGLHPATLSSLARERTPLTLAQTPACRQTLSDTRPPRLFAALASTGIAGQRAKTRWTVAWPSSWTPLSTGPTLSRHPEIGLIWPF